MKRTMSMLAMMLLLGVAGSATAQTSTDQNPDNQIVQTNDPNATNDANATTDGTVDRSAENTMADDTNNLPNTASPLPLVMAVGAGIVAIGYWIRRRRRTH